MNEEGATAAKRHLIINVAGLIQPIYFENAFTSKFKSKDMLLWRGLLLLFPEEMKGYELRKIILVKKNKI